MNPLSTDIPGQVKIMISKITDPYNYRQAKKKVFCIGYLRKDSLRGSGIPVNDN
jgi:hypothetical protein